MIKRFLLTVFFCAVLLATPAVCRVGRSDLRGAFTLLNVSRGRFPWCTGNLLMTSSQRTVLRFQVSDGTGGGAYADPCARALPHTMRYMATRASHAKFGRTVYRNNQTEPWTCGTQRNITVRVFRTAGRLRLVNPAGGSALLGKGFLHVTVTDGYRGCIWWRSGKIRVRASPVPVPAAPTGIGNGSGNTTSNTASRKPVAISTTTATSPAASPAPPIDGSSGANISSSGNATNSGAGGAENNNQRGSSRNIWEWLGPVLGAGATVIAAVLTVYLSREYWSRRFQRERMMRAGGDPSVSVGLDGTPR